jgi:5-dehydro-4-deoxyglucarate dehydratase
LAAAGHAKELGALMEELVVPLYALRARRKGYEVAVMKAMMDLVGLAGGRVRPPLVELRTVDLELLRNQIPRWRRFIEA